MGWSWDDTLNRTPAQLLLVYEKLIDVLCAEGIYKRKDGEEEVEEDKPRKSFGAFGSSSSSKPKNISKYAKEQIESINKRTAERIKKMKAEGKKTCSFNELFGNGKPEPKVYKRKRQK